MDYVAGAGHMRPQNQGNPSPSRGFFGEDTMKGRMAVAHPPISPSLVSTWVGLRRQSAFWRVHSSVVRPASVAQSGDELIYVRMMECSRGGLHHPPIANLIIPIPLSSKQQLLQVPILPSAPAILPFRKRMLGCRTRVRP